MQPRKPEQPQIIPPDIQNSRPIQQAPVLITRPDAYNSLPHNDNDAATEILPPATRHLRQIGSITISGTNAPNPEAHPKSPDMQDPTTEKSTITPPLATADTETPTTGPQTADEAVTLDPMVDIHHILSVEPEAFESKAGDFIAQRIAALTTPDPPELISYLDGNHQGFIQPTTDLVANIGSSTFRIDDTTIYNLGLSYGREAYAKLIANGMTIHQAQVAAAVYGAQLAQQAYFGNVHPDEHESAERERMLGPKGYDEEDSNQTYSIGDLKGKAACLERASVANNVMWLLGAKPVLELGHLSFDGGNPELHAALRIRTSAGNEALFDVNNPHIVEDGVKPAVYQYDGQIPSKGMNITGTRKVLTQDGTGTIRANSVPVNFTTDTLRQDIYPS